MATSVVSISFDQELYKEERECEDWLRQNPEYSSLLALRDWKLKTVASCKRMHSEGRKIFYWSKDIANVRCIAVVRPTCYVRVELRAGGDLFTPLELPPLSQKGIKRKAQAEEKQRAKDENKQISKERAKINRLRKAFAKKEGLEVAQTYWDADEKRVVKRDPAKHPPELILLNSKKVTVRRQRKRVKKDELVSNPLDAPLTALDIPNALHSIVPDGFCQ